MKDERCPTCGSPDVIKTGPLTVQGSRLLVTVGDAMQCILCGHLAVMIPQMVLIRLYPPNVRYLTTGRRTELQLRRKLKKRRRISAQ